jgi:hypothetical protein
MGLPDVQAAGRTGETRHKVSGQGAASAGCTRPTAAAWLGFCGGGLDRDGAFGGTLMLPASRLQNRSFGVRNDQ